MIAYFLEGCPGGGPARDFPQFARLLPAGPWTLQLAVLPSGKRGAAIWWEGHQVDLQRADWRHCDDGLLYLSPAKLPDQSLLAKSGCPAGIDITTSSGACLTIPLAAAAPRKVSLSRLRAGEPSSDFGLRALRLSERLAALPKDGGIDPCDGEVLGVVTQALMTCYRVTPELIDDLGWIATTDIAPIISAVMGSDPKASAPGQPTSPSPAEASPTSR